MSVDNSTSAIDPLPGYTETKLKLASIAEILLTLVRERKDEARIHKIQRLLADLAEDAFRLAVVGKYNRGKSSLMNAMLGQSWLPTGILPLTSVITTVRYGTKQRVSIRTEGSSLPHEIPLGDLPQYVSEEGNPGNQKKIDVAEIFLPASLLRYGFLFIDTPGLGSGIAANTEATRKFLPELDAAIIVLSFESPLDQTDIDLLLNLSRLRRKLFVVVNKADLISSDERDRVISFLQKTLGEHLGEAPPLFSLSARDGLKARLQKDASAWSQSGLENFERELVHFLTTQKAKAFLHRVIERVEILLDQEELEQTLAQQLSIDDAKAGELRAIEEEKNNLLRTLDPIFDRLRERLPALFFQLLDDGLNNWCFERKNAKTDEREDRSANSPNDLAQAIRDRIVPATEQLRQSVRSELDGVTRAVGDLRRRGDELLGRTEERPLDNECDISEGVIGRDISLPQLPAFEWSPPPCIQALPIPWLRKKASFHPRNQFAIAVESYCGQVRALVEQSCRQWLDQAQRQAVQKLQASVLHIQSLGDHSHASETLSALHSLKQALSEITRNAHQSAGPHRRAHLDMDADGTFELCFVCRKVSDASLDFFRRFQYEVTKNPRLQAELKSNSGFCPFHTWMYESVGSPQGIAQGYAMVLENVADGLEDTLHKESSSHFTACIRDLLPTSERCKACRVVNVAESLALDEIVSAGPPDALHRNICLIHLSALTTRLGGSQLAKSCVEREAVRIRALAQDMRQFALKHNALRHYLSTEGERDAYVHGLMQIVGARQLSYIRQVKEIL